MRFDLYSPEAQSLRNSLAVAGEALEEAGSAIRMLLKPSWIRIGVTTLCSRSDAMG